MHFTPPHNKFVCIQLLSSPQGAHVSGYPSNLIINGSIPRELFHDQLLKLAARYNSELIDFRSHVDTNRQAPRPSAVQRPVSRLGDLRHRTCLSNDPWPWPSITPGPWSTQRLLAGFLGPSESQSLNHIIRHHR